MVANSVYTRFVDDHMAELVGEGEHPSLHFGASEDAAAGVTHAAIQGPAGTDT